MDKERLIENEEQNETLPNIYPPISGESKVEYENAQHRDNDSDIQQFPTRQSSERNATIQNTQLTQNPVIDDDDLEIQIVYPDHYSGWAWLSILFCCFPLSIAAVYFSDKTIKAIRKRDIFLARRYSYLAKKLSFLALIFGLFMIGAVAGLYYLFTFSSNRKS